MNIISYIPAIVFMQIAMVNANVQGVEEIENISSLPAAGSPFHNNREQMLKKFMELVESGQELKALALVRSTIRIEKTWRQQYCMRLFGENDCLNDNSNPEPFFMWKRKMIHNLRKDPSGEIFQYFRSHVKFLK